MSTARDNVNKFLYGVHRGHYDEYLEEVMADVHLRRKQVREQLALRNQAELKPGTDVVITNLRPRYLAGCRGKVVGKPLESGPERPGTIWVDLGFRVRNYGPVVGVPASCLEKA